MLDKLKKELKAREAAHLQVIESNPFDADDIAMFEMFEREGFSAEECRAYILAEAKADASGAG